MASQMPKLGDSEGNKVYMSMFESQKCPFASLFIRYPR